MTYNGMMRPQSISENGRTSLFTYNAAGDRVKMETKEGDISQLQRYYLGGVYEIDQTLDYTAERLYLGGDAYSAPAVYVRQGTGAWQVQYIGRDYLGSITHVTDATGVVKQELSYDPWGRLRNPVTQALYDIDTRLNLILGDRGYTGHEHLTEYGLINMNARLYDPVVGRFLSPDPYVQAPLMSQNFNRYSYALNNPLRYTDPNGEFIFTALLPGIGVFLDAACWGALIGGGIGGTVSGFTGGNVVAGVWKGAVTGFAGGLLSPIGGAGMSFIQNVGMGALQGMATGALSSALYKTNLGQSVLWGGITGAAFAAATSSEMKNLFRGKGFKSNQSVFEDILSSGYKNGVSAHNQVLDYFGFEGKFDQTNPLAIKMGASGITDPLTGEIFYNSSAFKDYNTLKYVADHELSHRLHIFSGSTKGHSYEFEEFITYKGLYENSGLYKGATLESSFNSTTENLRFRANQYLNELYRYQQYNNIIRSYETSNVATGLRFGAPKWKEFIYNLPRRF